MATNDDYNLFKECLEQFNNEESQSLDQATKDYESFKIYLELWKSENPIKTNKLQVLLVVNGLLVSALQVAGGFKVENWPLFLAGAAFSIVWVLSIGRTSLYQKYWQEKMKLISDVYSNDNRFKILDVSTVKSNTHWLLKLIGGVSSKYYLLGAPIVFSLFWVVAWVKVYS